MALKESEAIILRTFPFGEGDRIVSFLDRHAGRIRGVAHGARSPKSRFGSTLELLSHVRICYFERESRELVRIDHCDLNESFMDVQLNYESSVALALLSEITENALAERQVSDPQFRLLLLAAQAIKSKGALESVILYFCLWTIRLGGWLGSLEHCMSCLKPLEGGAAYYSPVELRFSCRDCRDIQSKILPEDTLSIGLSALGNNLTSFLTEGFSTRNPSGIHALLDYCLAVLELHFERRLTTWKMLAFSEL